MSELLSIIMPIYNGEGFIDAAMTCLRKITYKPLEIIVVDDGSTDNSASIILNKYPWVKLITQQNQGPANARNHALDHALGEFVGFLDVDDLFPDGATDLLMKEMLADPSLSAVHGKVQFKALEGADDRIEKMKFTPEDQMSKFHYNLGAMIVRRHVFAQLGNFPDTRFSEDVDFHLRLSQSSLKVKRIEAITLVYQIHSQNMTRELQNSENRLNPEFLLAVRKAVLRKRATEDKRDES